MIHSLRTVAKKTNFDLSTKRDLVWIRINDAQRSPSRVKSGPGAIGEMLLLVDLIELARAIDRHWLPHVCDTSFDALLEILSVYGFVEETEFSACHQDSSLLACFDFISISHRRLPVDEKLRVRIYVKKRHSDKTKKKSDTSANLL